MMSRHSSIFAAFLTLCVAQFSVAQIGAANSAVDLPSSSEDKDLTVAIVGGTLIDVANYGATSNDVPRSIVLVRDGHILAVGDDKSVAVPAGADVIEASGTYVIPGLIDGFGAVRTQGFADAYLYEGVTSVFVQQSPVGEDGEATLFHASPSPDVLRGQMIGGYSVDGAPSHVHPWTERRKHDPRLSSAQLTARVDQIAEEGARGVLIGMDVWPDQLDVIVREAHARRLMTMGEVAFTNYPYAVRAGVDSLLRSDHYQIAVVSDQDWLIYSDDPEGPGSAAGYRNVCTTELTSATVTGFGKQLAASNRALMPMLSIEANADDLNVPNPWTSRTAAFVRASDLDDPVDPATGVHPYLASHPDRASSLRKCAFHREDMDGQFQKLGVHFLAGTASPSFGAIPGGSLHLELELLKRIGLTPREALAAATNNFSEIYGWKDRGRIAPGARADLVLLTEDPRADIKAASAIKLVMLGGMVVDRQRLLANAESDRIKKLAHH